MCPYMKSTYEYTKSRKNFGRQALFQSVAAHILDSILPDKEEQKKYILRNPVHREITATMAQSENETNTPQVVLHEQGINHNEGGWPREVHVYNEDHVFRYRRRIMHDENYIHTVMSLSPVVQHYVNQNNAIEMYQTYFDDMKYQEPVEKYNVSVANVFRDSHHKPISCIQWTNEKKSKLAVAYCERKYSHIESSKRNYCYLWDVNRQTEPVHEITPKNPCWQLACSPVNSELIIAGLSNGTVNLFDIRQGSNAVYNSSVYNSHRDPVTALLYTHSRTHTEFFTGSIDGQCLWWDLRNLSKPLDCLVMSIRMPSNESPSLNKSEGVSSLEFDHGLPTKFLCGTESGLVINVNRMGRIHSEMLTSYWDCHAGPVRSVHRSNCTTRMFLTCGDWSVRIWSEEVHTAPIIVTKPYRYEVTDAAWAPLRYSSYMVACSDGIFSYWDILRKYKAPVISFQVSKYELTKICPHTNGQSVAIGDNNGCLFLLMLSQNMILPSKYDKQLMLQIYSREARREHNLDTRLKEIRLKMRTEQAALVIPSKSDLNLEDQQDRATDQEYFDKITSELKQMEMK